MKFWIMNTRTLKSTEFEAKSVAAAKQWAARHGFLWALLWAIVGDKKIYLGSRIPNSELRKELWKMAKGGSHENHTCGI